MSAVTTSVMSRELARRPLRERYIADQVGRVALALLLIVAAAVYLVAPFQAINWAQTPFVGGFVEYPNNVNVAIIGGGQGLLQEDEQIVRLDGQPINSASELYSTLRRQYTPGDVVTLDLFNRQTNAVRQVTVTLQRLPVATLLGLFVAPYMAGLVYLGVGLWVYRRRRTQAVGRVFLMLCGAVALALGTTFDLWTTHNFVRLWAAAIPLAAGLLMVFTLLFPTEAVVVIKRPWLRWMPMIPTFALIAVSQWMLGMGRNEILRAWYAGYYYAGATIVLFAVVLFIRALFAASPSVREQSRLVVGGVVIAFAPFVLWALDTAAGVHIVSVPMELLLIAFLFFPLVIAYSIVQYSVLDTSRLLSFTATYAIMAAIVMVGYGLLVSGLSLLTTAALGEMATNPLMVGLLAFTLVLVFQPFRQRLQQVIDSFFFRARSEYEERLTTFRHDLTLASGLNEVVRLLKQQIRETLVPTHTYVFLRDPQSGDFIAIGEGSRPDTDIRFEPHSGLVHALSTTRDVIFLELSKPLPPELIEEHARLAILRTPVLAPLQGQERLAGWIAVGNKRSGEPFGIQDLRFILALAEQASLAVERAQVISDLEQRVRELDVLSQVSQAVNFTTDPDVLLELIYTQTSRLIDTTNFYIVLHNPDRHTLSYALFIEGDERREDRENIHWPDNEGLAAEVIRTGRPLRTEDYVSECTRRGISPGQSRHYAWMGVPLNAGTTTLGAIVVASYIQGVIFTDEQLKILWAIADQAATALDKARLFRETERRARQLATLNEISKELSSTLDLENLLVRILRSAVDILNTEAGSLFLVDENTGELVFRVVQGGAQNLVGTRLPPGVGIVGQAVERGEPVISNDVLKDRRWFSEVDRETAFQTQSLLAVPLRIQDRSIGVVEVINKKDGTPFQEEDAALLTTFAAQAAIALDNARLLAATDAELSARVDELQNLQRIDRELNRTLKLDRVINITLEWALRTTGASAGAIGMLTADGTGIEILAASGYREDFLEQYKEKPFPADKGIVGRVLSSGKAEFTKNVGDDPDFVPASRGEPATQITVPIMRANKPVGVLVLESDAPDRFSPQDFDFAQRLVEHAAVAIENARLLEEIEQANRSKTEFISFVAHELKNPMTSIRGYTDLLRGGQAGPLNDTQTQFLNTIRSNIDRMTRLVSDLSDVARIETGHLRLDMSPLSVRMVVDETLRSLEEQIEYKNQELIVQVPDDLPFIFADHIRMVQVLTNLVSNAHKYTPEGGRITIGARLETVTDEATNETKPVVHHWVSDTGIGMTQEELDKLFTKFFRTERAKNMAQGTGLGLNITKSLIEAHGGKIWVESAPGAGTTFHYTVPVALEAAATDRS